MLLQGSFINRLLFVSTSRADTGGDRRLQNMEPAVLGRMCVGGDYDETVNICLQTYSTGV
jgi:hypothetical protein